MADTKNPNFGATSDVPEGEPQTNSGYISREQLEKILAERDARHADELATVRASIPQLMVSANSGGPGNDNHQASWNLAEQEAANRGEILDHWKM